MKTYEHRRAILADGDLPNEVKVVGAILDEHLDWNTGVKKTYGKPHLQNWLNSLADAYGISREDFDYGIKVLGRSGYYSVTKTGDGLEFAMTDPEDADGE